MLLMLLTIYNKPTGFARRSERIEALSKKLADKKGKLFAVKCDITKEEDIIKGFQWVAENMGPVHILVNNAGVLRLGTLTEGKTEDWKQILDTNVLGLCICTREAAKSMKENNIDGHVVHINSIAGHWVGDFPKLNVYGASKFAVTALTDTLRKEFNLNGSKIKVTSVSPGAVRTEIMTSVEDFDAEIIKNIPILESEDVADAVLYAIVCGISMYNGTEVKMDVHTPPPTSVLAGDIALKSEGTTVTTISITIPGVQANTTSRSSYVYVVVSEQKSNNITKRDADLQESSEKEEILQFAPEVAAGAYDITIVLMNVYKDKRSYKDYKSLSKVYTASLSVLLSVMRCCRCSWWFHFYRGTIGHLLQSKIV
ncbi:uncharacterized protein CBL_09964 [Carabus blaptoides fortunei]